MRTAPVPASSLCSDWPSGSSISTNWRRREISRRLPSGLAAPITNGVLQVEERAQRLALVAPLGLVDQDRPLLHQVAVTFEDQIDGGVQQRMAGADELGLGLPGTLRSSFSKQIRW